MMPRGLTSCLLLTIAVLALPGSKPPKLAARPLVMAGLADDAKDAKAVSGPDDACAGVSLSRSLKYGESERNVLDVATTADKGSAPRPVLLFVAGERFAEGDDPGAADGALRDQAMCLAARSGTVGVTMSYRLAPADPWPAGARDVAAATSWIHQNIDLFGGDAQA